MERITLTTKPSAHYELLDSGDEVKLERFGDIVLARPDPQALWEKSLGQDKWENATGCYFRESADGGKWVGKLPPEWQIEFGGLNFVIRPTSFKHTGLFPEQLPNWEWVRGLLEVNKTSMANSLAGYAPRTFDREVFSPPQILNLFAYTGGATLAAAQAGAEVTHVDASKMAVTWARENAKISGLEDKPIRWIVDDALLFVKRELKRGKRYDGIIMDPPAFGHGPKNELWKIEENFVELVKLCQELLSERPLFFLINGYAAGYSPLAFAYNLEPLIKKFGGDIEYGDLTIEESSPSTALGIKRTLPCGIFARWSIH